MSVQVLKKAARLKLAELTPAIPTAYEAFPFDPPAGLYQRLQFVVQRPDDPVLGDQYYRERIQMQVFLNAPAGVGTSQVDTQAELLRQHFRKGLSFEQDGMNVYVLRTPQISGTIVLQNRVIIPVFIELVGEVFS